MGQPVPRHCSRTYRGWPADGPPPASRLARSTAVLCSPWQGTGARPASAGGAAAWLRWGRAGGAAGCWPAWPPGGGAGGWEQQGHCKGQWSQVWDNHMGPSCKKKRVSPKCKRPQTTCSWFKLVYLSLPLFVSECGAAVALAGWSGWGGGAVVGEMPRDKSQRLSKNIRVCRWDLCVCRNVCGSRGLAIRRQPAGGLWFPPPSTG